VDGGRRAEEGCGGAADSYGVGELRRSGAALKGCLTGV
jgi:hypothetical protein